MLLAPHSEEYLNLVIHSAAASLVKTSKNTNFWLDQKRPGGSYLDIWLEEDVKICTKTDIKKEKIGWDSFINGLEKARKAWEGITTTAQTAKGAQTWVLIWSENLREELHTPFLTFFNFKRISSFMFFNLCSPRAATNLSHVLHSLKLFWMPVTSISLLAGHAHIGCRRLLLGFQADSLHLPSSVASIISCACPSCKENSPELYCWPCWVSITHCPKWKEQKPSHVPRNVLPAIVCSAITEHGRSHNQAPVSHEILLSAAGEGPFTSWWGPWLLKWQGPCYCGISVKQEEKPKERQEFLAINGEWQNSGKCFLFLSVSQSMPLSVPSTYYSTYEAPQLFVNVIVQHKKHSELWLISFYLHENTHLLIILHTDESLLSASRRAKSCLQCD